MKSSYLLCLITSILLMLSSTSYGDALNPDTLYVEGASLSDNHTGIYNLRSHSNSAQPYYEKGNFIVQKANDQKWKLYDHNSLIASSTKITSKPWRGKFNNGVKIYINKSNRWGDTYSISFSYSNLNTNKSFKLISRGIKPKFRAIDLFTDIDAPTKRSSWVIQRVSEQSDQYFIASTVNRRVLIMENDGTVKTRQYSCEIWNNNCGELGQSAKWRFDVMSNSNDMLIINTFNGQERVLKIVEPVGINNRGREYYNVIGVPNSSENNFDHTILFHIKKNFINMTLYPEDFARQNSHMHLSNGLAVKKLFVPLPDSNYTNSSDETTRQYEISIKQPKNMDVNEIYEFVDCSNDQDRIELTKGIRLSELTEQIQNMVEHSDLTGQEVRQLLAQQINSMCGVDVGDFTPGIIWLPNAPSEGLAIFERIRNGHVEFNAVVNGETLHIIDTEKCSNNNTQDCSQSDSFGFLIKRTARYNNGGEIITYIIDDPTRSSGYVPR